VRSWVLAVVLYLLLTAILTGVANSDRDGEPWSWPVKSARWLCNIPDWNDAPSRWCWLPFGEEDQGLPEPDVPFEEEPIEGPD